MSIGMYYVVVFSYDSMPLPKRGKAGPCNAASPEGCITHPRILSGMRLALQARHAQFCCAHCTRDFPRIPNTFPRLPQLRTVCTHFRRPRRNITSPR